MISPALTVTVASPFKIPFNVMTPFSMDAFTILESEDSTLTSLSTSVGTSHALIVAVSEVYRCTFVLLKPISTGFVGVCLSVQMVFIGYTVISALLSCPNE